MPHWSSALVRDAGLAGRRFLISGRVQGVGFRAATRRRALQLGLVGHARNLPDGRVEVVAAGAPEAVDALVRWLAEGPPLSRVDAVEEAGPVGLSDAGFVTG
jgi:acylphosphatase